MDDPRKILLIQLKRAGDVVLTTPVLEVLKRRYPAATLDFLVDAAFAPLLEHNPHIDHVLRYDREHPWRNFGRIRRESYDWVVDFQSSPRSAPIVFLSGARITAGYKVRFWGQAYRYSQRRPGESVGVVRGKVALLETLIGAVSQLPQRRVYTDEAERAWAESLLPKTAAPGWIGLVPPHRHSSRRWPGESFAAVARLLTEAGRSAVFFAGPGEEAYVRSVQAAAPLARQIDVRSFREWAALLERCGLVISNDNGPMHIAVGAGCRTVTIYGPTDAACLRPEGAGHRGLQRTELGCIRCNMNVCPFGHECMTELKPAEVYAACEELLAEMTTGARA